MLDTEANAEECKAIGLESVGVEPESNVAGNEGSQNDASRKARIIESRKDVTELLTVVSTRYTESLDKWVVHLLIG